MSNKSNKVHGVDLIPYILTKKLVTRLLAQTDGNCNQLGATNVKLVQKKILLCFSYSETYYYS